MKRRSFIQTSSLLTLPVLLRGMEVTAVNSSSLATLIGGDSDKVLVLIQLNGGNDGLNTFLPLDQYSNLTNARQNIIIPESSVLKTTDKNGFNPAMATLHSMYKEGKVSVVQGVSYPDQNRSHFRSTDIWTSASDSDDFLSTGWLGRHFDLQYPGYPTGFPNADCPDPFAITLGYIVSETCQGQVSNFSYAVASENEIKGVPTTTGGGIDNTCYGNELLYVRDVVRQSNAYSGVVLDAFDKGSNIGVYPDNKLADQLKIVANLISGGLRTKVYVVSMGGFDTHANQVVSDNPLTGTHSELLATLSDSINAFQKDIEALGVSQKVVGMTFSEFGRRIRSNDAYGTDHGTAAPLILFGDCIKGSVIGENATISSNPDVNEGVAMQYDFRSIYATVLMDWFGIEESQVKDVLFEDFQRLPIFKNCDTPSSADEIEISIESNIYPNPVFDVLNINLNARVGGHLRFEIYDTHGSRLYEEIKYSVPKGEHMFTIKVDNLSSGPYFLRLSQDYRQKSIRFVIVR